MEKTLAVNTASLIEHKEVGKELKKMNATANTRLTVLETEKTTTRNLIRWQLAIGLSIAALVITVVRVLGL